MARILGAVYTNSSKAHMYDAQTLARLSDLDIKRADGIALRDFVATGDRLVCSRNTTVYFYNKQTLQEVVSERITLSYNVFGIIATDDRLIFFNPTKAEFYDKTTRQRVDSETITFPTDTSVSVGVATDTRLFFGSTPRRSTSSTVISYNKATRQQIASETFTPTFRGTPCLVRKLLSTDNRLIVLFNISGSAYPSVRHTGALFYNSSTLARVSTEDIILAPNLGFREVRSGTVTQSDFVLAFRANSGPDKIRAYDRRTGIFRKAIDAQADDSQLLSYVSDLFYFETIDPVSASFSTASGVKTGDFSVNVTFDTTKTVSGFVAGDISLTRIGNTGADTMVSGLDDYTITSISGNSFRINFTPNLNIFGTYSLDISGLVVVDGQNTPVVATELLFTVNTFYHAILGTPIVDNKQGTAVVPVTFADAVSQFWVSSSPISGHTRGVSYTISGSGRNWQFNFAIQDDQSGTFTVDLDNLGWVVVNGAARPLTSNSVDVHHNTTDPVVSASFSNFPTEVVRGNTSADITFMTLNTSDVISDFTASDIVLTGDVSGITHTITTFDRQTHRHRIHISIPSEKVGSFTITTPGTVNVNGVVNTINATGPTIHYDTRQAIPASWDNIAGVKTGNFAIDVAFAGAGSITGVEATDFQISHVSGASLIDLGILDYTVGQKSSDPRVYQLVFTPTLNQEGIFEIDLVGQIINAGTPRSVAIQSARISINTRNEVIPAVDIAPVWENIPTAVQNTTQFNVDLNFGENITGLSLADIQTDGVKNKLIVLYRVINGVEQLHSDESVAAALYRMKITISGNQEGILTLILKSDTVIAVDNEASGPEFDFISPGIPYDTRSDPIPPPIWSIIGTIAMNPGDSVDIDVSDYLSGNVSAVALTGNPTWAALTGTGIDSVIQLRPPSTITTLTNTTFTAVATGPGGSASNPVTVIVIPEYAQPVDMPIAIERWLIPDDIQSGATVMYSVIFTRALTGTETLTTDDIIVDGITGATVMSVAADTDNDRKYDIEIAVPARAEGVLNVFIK